jgi:hypothetical protein
MAIGDDFTIYYDASKRIRHTSGTTVYSVNALLTWLMDIFDESLQMDNDVPMEGKTPSAYVIGSIEASSDQPWFIDDESIKYLKEGAIETAGWGSFKVHVLLVDGQTTQAQASDLGKIVSDDGTPVGPLVHFETISGTEQKWWIRDTRGTPAVIGDGSTMTIAASSADGSADGVSLSGENLYSNAYTIAGLLADDPSPQVYLYQDGDPIAEWSDLGNWDRGDIDVLIKVKEAGTLIDSGLTTWFARQGHDSFAEWEIDLSAGGRNPIALNTSTDINNTTPEYYVFYDAGNGTDFQVGEIINDDNGDWTAEVAYFDEWSAGVGMLGLTGFSGTIADGDTFSGITSGGTGTINGSGTGVLGTAFLFYDTESGGPFTPGNVLEYSASPGTKARRRIIGLQDDGLTGKLLLDLNTGITGSNRNNYYMNFEDDIAITDGSASAVSDVASGYGNGVAGFDDVTIAFVNGTANHGGTSGGPFIEYERVTFSGGSGIVLYDSGSQLTLANMTITAINGLTITGDISGANCVASQDLQTAHTMNRNFTQQTAYPYDVHIEGGDIYNAGRPIQEIFEYCKFVLEWDSLFQLYTVVSGVITQLNGEEYRRAYDAYDYLPEAPLGTFAGGIMFTGYGVWVEGMDSDDAENILVKDSNGDTHSPPTQATMKVTNLLSGDRVLVCIRDNGKINKAQYNSHDTLNVAGDTIFEIEEDIAQDTPDSGILRVVDDDGVAQFPEQRYRFSSWAGKIFTLTTGIAGAATPGSSGDILVYATGGFNGLSLGDTIRNTSDGSVGYVYQIDSDTQLRAKLFGGANDDFENGDNFQINYLGYTYDDGDTCYVPMIDETASGVSAEVTLLFDVARNVLIRVRRYQGAGDSIVPYEATGEFTSGGLTANTIRADDDIVS